MGEFVCTPMHGSDFDKQGNIPEGSAGVYDNSNESPFDEYPRTKSSNGVREKFYEKAIGSSPSGEPDQGFSDDIHK